MVHAGDGYDSARRARERYPRDHRRLGMGHWRHGQTGPGGRLV